MQDETAGSGALRVLLVDDVQENLELLEDVLSENGYLSVLAKNGVEALQRLEEAEVHLIVADAMMPKMDGFQLCKEVRARRLGASVPFVIYTGNYVDAADQDFARSIGVDRYVVKYAGLGALVQAVNELAQQRYGHRPDGAAPPPEQIDEQAFLQRHRQIVIRKLEEKMAELEMYAETLVRKNREIQASEERYRALFDHASIAIFVVDRATGKVLDANRQGLALLRHSKDELLAMPRLPFAGRSDLAAGMLAVHDFVSGEAALRTRDGATIEVDVGVGPLTDPQETRLLLYVRDITEQKKLREQLLQAEKMSLMGRLAAGIAHEVRNPLSAISLNLQYLAQKCDGDAEVTESVRDALEGARRIETVIENTLSLARITPPVLREEQVNAMVEQVIRFAKVPLHARKIRLTTAVGDGLPPVMVDGKQIHQVLLNVLQNAIDASPEGGAVDIATEHRPAEGVVVVAIRDRGPGIPAEQRKHLFQQFRTTKIGGTGLGLALSKQIMDRHRGDIRIDAAPGGGTLVHILFPAHVYQSEVTNG